MEKKMRAHSTHADHKPRGKRNERPFPVPGLQAVHAYGLDLATRVGQLLLVKMRLRLEPLDLLRVEAKPVGRVRPAHLDHLGLRRVTANRRHAADLGVIAEEATPQVADEDDDERRAAEEGTEDDDDGHERADVNVGQEGSGGAFGGLGRRPSA